MFSSRSIFDSMNLGAYTIDPQFLDSREVQALTALALRVKGESTPTHTAGKYTTSLWSYVSLAGENNQVPSNVNTPEVEKIISFFKTRINMAVFYYLEPGGTLHPHRDHTGARMNDRMRFHIPLKTNDQVFFNVSGRGSS